MRQVLFDTDIGSDCDDAVALALVLKAADALDLVAVTTVSSDARKRGEIAASLLALAGRNDVEVCAGAEGGLVRPRDRYNWFGHEPDCVADVTFRPVSDEPAPERIVRAAREHEGLEIVMVGPLTNLALALAIDPSLPGRVGGVTIMGGHVREARLGDFVCPFGIDYNLCSDPEASVAVLGAGFETTLVTADVTLQTWLRRADVERLAASTPLAREVARQVRFWEPVQRRIFTGMGGTLDDDNVSFLHDPLTVLALFDASPLGFERLAIVPTIERGILRTHEVAADAGLGSVMRVATTVDAKAARDRITERLLGSPA
ncbi:MAG: nucleoside hydrolase [Myxococcota bacterium]